MEKTMKQARKFQRRTEDFVCDHCGAAIKGNGYTDHCPICLYSKHVDINPGDRASACAGPMEPIGAYGDSKGITITYKCKRCHAIKRVRAASEDNQDTLLSLVSRSSARVRRLKSRGRQGNRNSTFK